MSKNNRGIWKYIKNYRFNSIFFKNFRLLLLLLVFPLAIITAIAYYSYSNISEKEISYANTTSLSRVKDIMDMIMSDTNKQSIWIASYKDVPFFMNSSDIDDRTFFTPKDIHDLITMFTLTYEYLDSIHVYSEKSDNVLSLRGSGNIKEFYDSTWLQSYKDNKDTKTTWTESREIESVYKTGSKNFLSFYRVVRDNQKSIGAIVINIDMEKLVQNTGMGDLENIYISDDKGNILYSRETPQIKRTISDIQKTENLLASDKKSSVITKVEGEKMVVARTSSSYNNWNYTSVLPLSQYESKVNILRDIMLLLVVLSVVITLLLSFFISVRLFRPVRNILSILDNPGELANAPKLEDKESSDEFKYISYNIIKALDHNQVIEEELKQRLVLLKKAQAVALQSQINPHFLYNTLESINWMALTLTKGKNNDVSDMVSSLSGMLRLSLENTDKLIPISQEIEHACCYIDIQKKRYDDKFDVIWQVKEEVLNYKILKITLQPLIENAIYHGIKPMEGTGIITIKSTLSEENIIIEVSDNGVGMCQEDIELLNNNMNDDYIKENEHIGILNVNQRIKLIYGDKYGLSIDSTIGQGTTVKILMPLVE